MNDYNQSTINNNGYTISSYMKYDKLSNRKFPNDKTFMAL